MHAIPSPIRHYKRPAALLSAGRVCDIARSVPTVALAGILAALCSMPAAADVIRLKNGGAIRGTIESPALESDDVTIRTLTGARVTVRHEQVQSLIKRSRRIEEYESRAESIPHTADAHWQLAEWCRENRLSGQRDEQLRLVLELDPHHEAARRGLGYTLRGAEWVTRHEAMLADGYILHKGRYITQQELDLLEKTQAQRDAEQQWYPRIRLWLSWATGTHEGRKADGIARLQNLNDPGAIPALVKQMADHDDPQVRRLFVQALDRIGGAASVAPLVHRSLVDPAADIRAHALQAIPPVHHKQAAALYVDALNNELRLIVRRAATGLSEIGDKQAIEPLINALITEHRYRITYQQPTQSFAVGSDGSIGFPGSTSGLPANVELLARTGQLPYGAVVIPPPGGTVSRSTIVKRREQNIEALNALTKLTGQQFGFDQRAWHFWWAAHQNGADWAGTQ